MQLQKRIMVHVLDNETAQLTGIIKFAMIRQLVLAFKLVWKHTLKDNSTLLQNGSFITFFLPVLLTGMSQHFGAAPHFRCVNTVGISIQGLKSWPVKRLNCIF